MGMTTLYMLITHDWSTFEKHGVFWGIVVAHDVFVDWIHQAMQESSEGQQKQGTQEKDATASQDEASVYS